MAEQTSVTFLGIRLISNLLLFSQRFSSLYKIIPGLRSGLREELCLELVDTDFFGKRIGSVEFIDTVTDLFNDFIG